MKMSELIIGTPNVTLLPGIFFISRGIKSQSSRKAPVMGKIKPKDYGM